MEGKVNPLHNQPVHVNNSKGAGFAEKGVRGMEKRFEEAEKSAKRNSKRTNRRSDSYCRKWLM